MSDRVKIFDTTLRDGEQSPGIALDDDQKVAIATQLARTGVDVIEAGFPVASPGDFAAVQRIAREVEGPEIAALARANADDIDRAWEAIRDGAAPRIHVFLATSPIHMEHKLRMSREEVLTAVKTNIARAAEHTANIEFSPEDATRSEPEFLVAVCRAAVEAGAMTVNIPDTVGYATPVDFGSLIARVVEQVKGDRDDVVISAHCHNDLGLAVANSLAAIRSGARQVEGAINGIGERAGNTAIEEIVMALVTRADVFGVEVGVKTDELFETSRMVSELTGYPVQYNKAVVGRNAFAHESGIHQHGVLRERTTYEIMDPTEVGQPGSDIVLGKHSGRTAFKDALDKAGLAMGPEAFEETFARFKELADRKVTITERELRAIADEPLAVDEMIRLLSLQVVGGSDVKPQARMRVQARELMVEYEAEGDGMIDAVFAAANEAFGTNAELMGYEVRPLSVGSDAMAEVEVVIRVNGGTHEGVGVSTDVVEGSARAFVAALNKVAAETMAAAVGAGTTSA